jgi:ADP-ribosyl-[dinitrogen reductase] hydrolase
MAMLSMNGSWPNIQSLTTVGAMVRQCVSVPIGWAFDTLEETLAAAKRSAEVTHNHPEGIKGAQATAACVFLARQGKSKTEIKEYIEKTFGYDLNRTCDEIRPDYDFHVSCQQSVPESIIAFLESTDYENTIRLASVSRR